MIDVHHYCHGREVERPPAEEISQAVDRREGLVWVDVAAPDENDLACLQEQFGLHPLAMEDIRKHQQRPKLEQYPSHAFVVAKTAELQEVDIFIGPGWVITVRETDADGNAWSLDGARTRFERVKPDVASCGFLLYILLDEIVDGYFNATDEAEDNLELLEDRIFGETLHDERAVQEQLFGIRRELLLFRRAVVPLREVVGALLRREVTWVDEDAVIHLQDVYDHVLRAIDLVDGQRELMGNAVDAHLAIISNRMNQVMKKMTSWGAILLGSTLVAGIYGMNFVHMPELHWRYGYAYALSLMLIITITGYLYFRRKDWL
jgi:magnesium transporter